MTPIPLSDDLLIAEVVRVIRRAAKIPAVVAITADSRLVEDLCIDSLDLVGVVLQIQDHFDVAIEEDAMPHLARVGDVAAYLAGHAVVP